MYVQFWKLMENGLLSVFGQNFFIFKEDSDPKHISKLAKNWFFKEYIPALCWPAQSSDLNSIENRWNDVKCTIPQRKSVNFDDFWIRMRDTGYSILKVFSQRILSRRSHALLENIGYSPIYWSNKLNLLKYMIFITEILICAVLLPSQKVTFDMLQALISRRLTISSKI